jgi:excisionase family DNA binding protein
LTGDDIKRGGRQLKGEQESIRALATVTLDARALEELGPGTLDRLAELVEARMMQRRAAGAEPLLNLAAAAELAGVHAETVRRAIRTGALEVAGYVGTRARVRREAVEAWVAAGRRPRGAASAQARLGAIRHREVVRRVLGDALEQLDSGGSGA